MGAPKQKWKPEEEAALKAGVAKYGVGKWSTILKDPEFIVILHSRSNVDLKDKWRNINVIANGLGSRQRGRLALKNNQLVHKHDDISVAPNANVLSLPEAVDTKPLATCSRPVPDLAFKKPISRLDDHILEAVVDLKEPRGSNRTTIAMYIEEKYATPPNFERMLAAALKVLTENRKLIKVKHCYRIAPISTSFDTKRDPSPLLQEWQQKESLRVEKNDIKIRTRAQIDEELEKMRSMTAEEAAAAAAQAVAEAEAAIAEAEQAAREAEEAEVEAEAARCFAEAAMKALNSQHYKPGKIGGTW